MSGPSRDPAEQARQDAQALRLLGDPKPRRGPRAVWPPATEQAKRELLAYQRRLGPILRDLEVQWGRQPDPPEPVTDEEQNAMETALVASLMALWCRRRR